MDEVLKALATSVRAADAEERDGRVRPIADPEVLNAGVGAERSGHEVLERLEIVPDARFGSSFRLQARHVK